MDNNFEIASAEFASGNYPLAVQFLQYVLARDDEHFGALRLMGLACLALNETPDGIAALEEASLLRPLDAAARIELAIGYGASGHPDLSCDLLMSEATGGRANASEMLRIAVGLEAVDEPRLAMEACRRAGAANPDSAEVHYQMGWYARRCGHSDSVVEALLRHAINLEPLNIHYRIGLASLLITLGRKSEAVLLLDLLIPESLDAVACQCCLKRIANLYFDFNDFDRASRCAQRLREIARPQSGAKVSAHSSPFGVA
ncbi:Anaphase-promoting complex, cyclosome, subunit 3 [Stieleria maiorica]|uniref:Anaphase-promoting complex, cyclosome, subunit 3 n=1 Tax=Stieleria maiorica TaxID=2795974 RepID=A0A5B9MDG3_9BACT|nr:hypothetical protein [Stieleria maiorica]QEF98276.1 Anaphase-promoting complex, cyclosome, subunit 3 [Stieleria maiorica]